MVWVGLTEVLVGRPSGHVCRPDQHLEGPDTEHSTRRQEEEAQENTTLPPGESEGGGEGGG